MANTLTTRGEIGRAITLVESTRPDHQNKAAELLKSLPPGPAGTHRIGISGPPGVGKSTLIESLGLLLIDRGHRVGVLAVDPSSPKGGSILGDKTRMPSLSGHREAFVRPSPSGGGLGGAARATREATIVLEAAGFDRILIESVGVGQSEADVADMTDTFLLLAQPAAGDELQGVKKGVLERADVVAVTKWDQDTVLAAERTARELQSALKLSAPAASWWTPPVLRVSGISGDGLETLADTLAAHRRTAEQTAAFDKRRAEQRLIWMKALVLETLAARVKASPAARLTEERVREDVLGGALTPRSGAEAILEAFLHEDT